MQKVAAANGKYMGDGLFFVATGETILRSSHVLCHSISRPNRRVRADRAYFLLGQSSAGLWVVRDKANRRGGVFVSQQDALKYIRHETDPRGQFVVVYLPSGLELDPT